MLGTVKNLQHMRYKKMDSTPRKKNTLRSKLVFKSYWVRNVEDNLLPEAIDRSWKYGNRLYYEQDI